jgi:hypothetical protein
MNKREKRFLITAAFGAILMASLGFVYADNVITPPEAAANINEQGLPANDRELYGCDAPDRVIQAHLMNHPDRLDLAGCNNLGVGPNN